MAAEVPKKLSLQSIRDALIRQEDTIIFALIERAQYRRNDVCYAPGAPQFAAVAGPSESFLESMLLETERTHARVRRYTAPDEHAFFPERLPPPALPLIEFPALLHPSTVNLNAQILKVYLSKVVPAICAAGDDEQHGSSVVADVSVLQAISKRVHYGLFVAESKFRSQPEE
jgi:chorismate mutase